VFFSEPAPTIETLIPTSALRKRQSTSAVRLGSLARLVLTIPRHSTLFPVTAGPVSGAAREETARRAFGGDRGERRS
jgi:hypothetical protein